MIATITYKNKTYSIDLSKPIDIAIALSGEKNPLAWYQDLPQVTPVVTPNWVGSVSEGAPVNFNTITFNPHAHGTHTETVGHIIAAHTPVNNCLDKFFFTAQLITIVPENRDDEIVLSRKQIAAALNGSQPEAVIIRSLPNTPKKITKNWSNTHWPYITEAAMMYLRQINVKHLLIDLPSVDPEVDGGALRSHKAFWDVENEIRYECTITEMVYVPHHVKDGLYFLNLQIAAFDNDAAPSRPILYAIL